MQQLDVGSIWNACSLITPERKMKIIMHLMVNNSLKATHDSAGARGRVEKKIWEFRNFNTACYKSHGG